MLYLSQSQISRLKQLQESNSTRKKYAGISLTTAGLAESVIELADIMKKVSVDNRMNIINSSTHIALDVYKSLVPMSNKVHYFTSGKKNKIGGNKKLKITPGNLKRSIKVLSDIKKTYKWKSGAIGPDYLRGSNQPDNLNSIQASNGFYAHMVYGSSKAWKTKIVNRARMLSKDKVLSNMAKEAKKLFESLPKSYWRAA